MMVESWNKLVGIIIVGVGGIFLGQAHVISGDATIGILSAILGYVFGNGHGILSAKRVDQGGVMDEQAK